MIVLSLDTGLDACQAAVVADGRTLAKLTEPMRRGHQERLASLTGEVMAAAGLEFSALDRIAVTAGPGSFTGLRVGLAFAKGLALALEIPCVGVGTLQALAASASPPGADEVVAVAVDGGRGQVWLQTFGVDGALSDPEGLEPQAAGDRLLDLGARTMRLIGSGAYLVADRLPTARIVPLEAPDPVAIAALAAQTGEPLTPPLPIYLRAPDARPSA